MSDVVYRVADGLLVGITGNRGILEFRVDSNDTVVATPAQVPRLPYISFAAGSDGAYASARDMDDIDSIRASGDVAPLGVNFPGMPSDYYPGAARLATNCSSVVGAILPLDAAVPAVRLSAIAAPGGTGEASNREYGSISGNVMDVRADARFIYFAIGLSSSNGISAVDIASGAVTPLTTPGQVSVFHLAVDDMGVYYGIHDTSTAGTIVMMAKQ